MMPHILSSYDWYPSYFTIKGHTICHFKSNASLNSQATALLSLQLLSRIHPEVDPLFKSEARVESTSHTYILTNSIDLIVRVHAVNSITIGRSHVWLTICPSVQEQLTWTREALGSGQKYKNRVQQVTLMMF